MTAGAAGAATADDARVRHVFRGAMIARIATVSAGGRPLIMPLWSVVLDGRIYMSNAATSPTVRNIAAHPEVLVLLEGRDGEVVKVRGAARYVHDAATERRVARASFLKYYVRPRALWPALRGLARMSTLRRYHAERADSGMIEVTPVSYAVGPV